MKENGVIYFKNTQLYPGDYTKNCGLTGAEIDANFHFLRGREITEGLWDEETHTLIFKTLDGNNIPISGFNVSYAISYSGSSYNPEEGTLTLCINGNELTLSGFSNCECEEIIKEVEEFSAITQDIIIALDNHSDIIEDLQKNVILLSDDVKSIYDELNKEIERSKKVDSTLQCEIENIQKELNGEAIGRKEQNTELSKLINNETLRAEAKESQLENSISKEASSLRKSISSLSEKLSKEIKRAESAEKKLNDKIDDLNKKSSAKIESLNNRTNSISEKLDNEINRSTIEDENLNKQINNVKKQLKQSTDSLNKKIDASIEEVKNDIKHIECNLEQVTDGLTDEIRERRNADNKLNQKIENEELRAKIVEENLTKSFKDLNSYARTSINSITIVQTDCLTYSLRVNGKNRGAEISIPKSQMLTDTKFIPSATQEDKKKDSSVIIGNAYLMMRFSISDGGTKYVYIPADDLVDIYEAGDGLELVKIDDVSTFKIKKSNSDEGYLVVDEDGIRTSGITYKIEYEIGEEKRRADLTYATKDELNEVEKKVDKIKNSVTDVQVNYGDGFESVVKNKTAKIDLSYIYSAIEKLDKVPSVTLPVLSVNLSTAGLYEVGTSVDISNSKITATYVDGKYIIDDSVVNAECVNNGVVITNSSSTPLKVTDSTNFKIEAYASYSDGIIPKSSLGNDCPDLQIQNGVTSVSKSNAITGFRRNFAKSVSTEITAFNSEVVRGLMTTLTNQRNFNISINKNDVQVIIAIPSTLSISKVLDENLFDTDIKDNFIKVSESLLVNGYANYTPIAYDVYSYTPDVPFGVNNIYKVTIA